MIFKRRDPKPTLRAVAEFMWPRGGWARAFHYVRHRMKRLPDSPERIARGVWAGVFVTFSPMFGLHFICAAIIARLINGNILASIMSTFVGNPLTFFFIGYLSLNTGHLILGTRLTYAEMRATGRMFGDAGWDLWHNFIAIFTPERADWAGLAVFFHELFIPYLIGGIIPGIIAATISYYLAVPLLYAYQKRRKGLIKAKFDALKQKAAAKADGARKAE